MPPGLSERRRRGIRLQPRDYTWLTELGMFGYLPTSVIHQRHFPDDRTGVAVRRRLRLFADHGLIQTVAIAIVSTDRNGRLPSYHRLTPYGAEIVFAETGIRPLRPGRSDPPKPHTILHRAGMAEMALRFNDACGAYALPIPEWAFEFDTDGARPSNAPLASRLLLRRQYKAPSGETLTCWPDALCRFALARENKSFVLAIAWEYDRSTERHAQIKTKLDAYLPWLTERSFIATIRDALEARVFFVVPSVERRDNLIQSFKEHATARFVRLAVQADVQVPALLTEPIWKPLDGTTARSILPSTPHPPVAIATCR